MTANRLDNPDISSGLRCWRNYRSGNKETVYLYYIEKFTYTQVMERIRDVWEMNPIWITLFNDIVANKPSLV